MKRYNVLTDIVRETRPKRIIEVGTHNGDSAFIMCKNALRFTDDKVHYIGFDVFDDATADNDAVEKNGKGAGSLDHVNSRLQLLSMQNDGRLTFEFIKGNTRDTLHGRSLEADLAFIDGGHSVETIAGDYEALKGSKIVVCDDYYDPPSEGFGCNFLADGWHLTVADGSVRMAVRGWAPHDQAAATDPEWCDSLAQLMEENGAKTIYEWTGSGHPRVADCVAAINVWDNIADLRLNLTGLAQFARKVGFFVFKVTPERGVAEIERALDGIWRVIDRVETPEGFFVSARPYPEVPEIQTKGAGADEARLSNARANCKAVKRRVMVPIPAHFRRAVIVGYAPSLQTTWPDIVELAKAYDTDIVTTSAAHDFMVERGVIPDFHVESDPRPHKAKHVNRIQRATQYLFASSVHPAYIGKIQRRKGNLALWHAYEGAWSNVIGAEYDLAAFPQGAPMVLGGANVGLRACMLFYSLGYRQFDVFGMDCSFAEDGTQHAGAHAGTKNAQQDFYCDGRKFLSSMLHAAYARQFMDMRAMLKDTVWRLYGDGLLQAMAAASMRGQQQKEAA